MKNPRFVGIKWPSLGKPETLERRYLGKVSKKTLNFMKALLKLDPNERLTSNEALNHPYFDGLRDNDHESIISRRSFKINQQKNVNEII